MISLDLSVSGGQLGRALAHEPEELAYAFVMMIEDAPDDLGAQVAEYAPQGEKENIVDFLRLLADQIESNA